MTVWTNPAHVTSGPASSTQFNEETVDDLVHIHDTLLEGMAIRSGTDTDTILSGTAGLSANSASFGETFAAAPVVVATAQVGGNIDLVLNIQSVSTAAFTWRAITKTGGNVGSNTPVTIHWIAIGALP